MLREDSTSRSLSFVRRFKDSDYWLWAEVATLAFLIPTAIALWIDIKDRQTQRIAQAWELATRPAPGNAGKVPALEHLNSKGIPLVGIDLSESSNNGRVWLRHVSLKEADLSYANLEGVDLTYADLEGTDFSYANLEGAKLHGANIEGADLTATDLEGADLSYANLKDLDFGPANIDGASLYGSYLGGVDLVGQDPESLDLRLACIDDDTRLPVGVAMQEYCFLEWTSPYEEY